jgi:hypothetical protein
MADGARLRHGHFDVRLEIMDSWALRRWLAARGASVEVIAPAQLRRDMASVRGQAAAHYD